jgi:dipeptidyl aminopeptidase/acylaminoacyl peptidase
MIRTPRILFAVLVLSTVALASGPADRQPTDPKAITAPTNPNAKPIAVEDLFYTRGINSASWSPDGRDIVFSTNLTGRFNVWKVNASGGWPVQLAVSDDRQYNEVYSPDGKSIVYAEDRGGNEYPDLYAIPSNGGAPVNLTNTPDIREDSQQFSPNGAQLAVQYKTKQGTSTDIAVMDWNTKKVRNLTNEKTPDYGWEITAWSRDNRFLYVNRVNTGATDASIYQIDVTSGTLTNLTPHEGKKYVIVSDDVSPDGRTLLITSDEKGGFSNVGLLDIATRKITWVTDTQWEAHGGHFAPNGSVFTYLINADGRTSVYVQTLGHGILIQGRSRKLDFPEGLTFEAGTPTSFAPDSTRLLVSFQNSQRPADYWVYDLRTNKPQQLTYSAIAGLSPANLPPSQLVHYKSFDGQMISAFLWMPFNLKRDGTNPAIVLPHGGPTGQTLDNLNRWVAALASRGYICIAPNVRGSTGYGMQFQNANHQDLGGGDLQDEVFATKFLVDTGYVDVKKIGITGGSYGGFMTLMAIGKTPDVWAAAVEQFGIIDWKTMLQNTDPSLQEYEKSLLGDPVKDAAVYENTSPLKFIDKEKAPLLVLQGENDIRVPKQQADQLVQVMKQAGKTVEVTYYPQEGHGFAKREHQIDAIQRALAWFDKYLKGGGGQAAGGQ